MVNRHDFVIAIKELLERHYDLYEIASKLRLDPEFVKMIIDSLT